MKNISKLIILFITTAFVSACASTSEESSQNNDASSIEEVISSSNSGSEKASSRANSSSGANKSSSSAKSSSSSNKSSQNAPSSSSSSSSSKSEVITFDDPKLESNSTKCDNHQLEESIRQKATLIQRGIKRKTCPNCGGFTESYYYDMDEFTFENTTYLYDGHERELLIEGLLPYGTTVEYENNKLTDIGSTKATARIYDPDGHLINTKTATLSIIENVGLPNIKITTLDGDDPDWHTQSDGNRLYEDMTVTVDNCEDDYKRTDMPGQIKVRGNSTNQEAVAKRAFRLKFTEKQNLLGLNEGVNEKSWVLLADFFDQSNFRNSSAFEMGNSLFNYSGFYSSDYKHVTLYMNGENRGVYLLAEQQQAKYSRIPVNEANEDYTGIDVGYIVEIDGLVNQQGNIDRNTGIGTLEGDPCFKTDSAGSVGGVNISDKPYVVKTDTYSTEQSQFIKKYINNCTKAFASVCNGKLQIVDSNGDIQNSPYSTAYETLNAFINLDSFLRMFILQEFMKDYDVGWGSFYMYVDFSATSRATRLTMGAPWDFDLGLGNKQSGGGWGGWGGWGGQQGSSSSDNDIPTSGIASTKDNFLNSSEYTNGMTTFNPWLYMLTKTDFFNAMITKYYSAFNHSGVYNRMINEIVYERVAFLEAFNDNHTRYGKGASGATLMQTRQYDTFDQAVDYLVKWLGERKEYLDSKYI